MTCLRSSEEPGGRLEELQIEGIDWQFMGPRNTYEKCTEPLFQGTVVEVNALVHRATDLWVSRVEPLTFVILGRNVAGNGLALAHDKVPLLQPMRLFSKMNCNFYSN